MNKILSKFIKLVKLYQTDIVLGTTVVLVSFLSFQAGKIQTLGRLQGRLDFQTADSTEILAAKKTPSNTPLVTSKIQESIIKLPVVASKKSNKYHFLWCSGASKISAKNKVTYNSEEEAIVAGLILASNCQR